MSTLDLWGAPITAPLPAPIADGRRRKTARKGYAALPGSGPAGETCRTCAHYCRIERAKVYLKCGKIRYRWTGGPGTDILARAPACSFWESGKGMMFIGMPPRK